MFILENGKELTDEKLSEFISKHRQMVDRRFIRLDKAYRTDYDIFHHPRKEAWKPDNRIGVNFAKYIVDTMNGFFMGQPIKISVDDDASGAISEYVEFVDQYNGQDDNNSELAKICDIFGRAYEMYYVDENGNVGITYQSPMQAFMIYDDSILERPRYFVRLYRDTDKKLHGSLSDATTVRYFDVPGDIKWRPDEDKLHGFNGVPAVEYKENEERIGIFEPVLSMINAYNKVLSEKANDVDYFADAYLKVLGATVDADSQKQIRSNRIINFRGNGSDSVVVDFMTKPDGDNSQEHLIDRLEKLIFQNAMVANISDENFGTSSGIALKYKLQAMSNLAKTKERKFTASMTKRYKLIFSNPINSMGVDDWAKLHYHFTLNYPANVSEEIENAKNLEGIVSEETQLKVLSIVDDVNAEIARKESEDEKYQSKLMTNDYLGGGESNADEEE